VDTEMGLHVTFCAGWGMTEADMRALPEASATMAYTRYVLERGLSGDILDLYTALVPCVVGYGEIGARLVRDSATKRAGTKRAGNPYLPWIEMYGSDDYQAVAAGAIAQLDRLYAARGSEARMADLVRTFRRATRLEAD